MSEIENPKSLPPRLESGIGLALSGGGYRAMVFHLGALIRLNEVALLRQVRRISSVSGGSITAGVLGITWNELKFAGGTATNFNLVVERVRRVADVTIDAGAIIGGIMLPGSISERVANAYDRILFKGARLRALPDDTVPGNPMFVFNATNIQTAALWRFSRRYMGDYRVGLVDQPDVRLADAVAASSAFPPLLSPFELDVTQPVRKTEGADLHEAPFTERAVLSDGGVYDNLGLESIIKRYRTILVSDGGQKIAPVGDPHRDWPRHSLRVLDTIDNQVRSLRKRNLIESYLQEERLGTYWGIRTAFSDYHLEDDPLNCRARDPRPLAIIPTRLESMPRTVQDRLINWGYAVCDAALRAHISRELQTELGISMDKAPRFPFSDGY